VVATVVWSGLVVMGVAWEVRCRRPGSHWMSLSELGGRMGSGLPGRIVLLVLWAFVGWHVFSRYTIPL
jgi:hypothetical protein